MKGRHRVVVTGIGLTTPIGHDLVHVCTSLRTGHHGIRIIEDWGRIAELRPRLGGAVTELDVDRRYPRKKVRTMGRVGRLATYACEQAIAQAGLEPALLQSGRVGIAYGSTSGSSQALEDFTGKLFQSYELKGLSATSFLKFMSHTCAANLAQFFGLRGRVIPTSSACTSGSQAIGYGYEAIADGRQEIMICGGAEELHAVTATIFDLFGATSNGFNTRPEASPRPFDRDRDGLVIGEGAASLVLERRDQALARGAQILGEVIGFGTNCDGSHITAPSQSGMRAAMALALDDAGLHAGDVDYISAHGTATLLGDVAESL
ncbi:MAG: beta-ketoacyl synthase N-terminal-like domain-containing protein, partial [Nannocystaceae bacterium]